MRAEDIVSKNVKLHQIVTYINKGENIFITGAAGTGKTYILKYLKEFYKDIVVTSTTGISAVNMGGRTIHSWANVGCMDIPLKEFLNIVESENFGLYGKAKSRIRKCELLAIDEVSMLSAYELEYLDAVFKKIRKNNKPFGGIQVVFLGDFLQLPPVATSTDLELMPRKQLFCFESDVWKNLAIKNIVLKKIYRQDDIEFAKLLCNFRLGRLTMQNLKLLSTRYVEDDKNLENKLHLFPRRIQAQAYNYQKLKMIDGTLYEYTTYDDIPEPENINDMERYKEKIRYELNQNCHIDWRLSLKVGARVMLLVNLDFEAGLINGSCGEVLELKKSYVLVRFDNGVIKKIGRMLFEYSEGNQVLAKRFQIPLKLAYAITIHKAQGMTLDEIVIDCRSSFAPGQVYVGLSRVKTLKGLYITGFNSKKVYPNIIARNFYLNLEASENERIQELLYSEYR